MNREEKVLEGQVAIVTGGGRGIGRAIAIELASSGARVAVVARSKDQLDRTVGQIEEAGGTAIAFSGDVTDPNLVTRTVAQAEAQLGPIDMLVNNAGMVGQPGPIGEADANEWWRVMDVNLRGPMLFARAVLPSMTKRKSGRIVNVSSGAGCFPWPNVSAYAISKAALTRFSEILALETSEDNIIVFSLAPGLVRTAMSERAFSTEWRKWDSVIVDLFEEGSDVPPEAAAGLTLDLMSGKADVLSGRMIRVSDDLEEMIAQAERIQEDELYVLRLGAL